MMKLSPMFTTQTDEAKMEQLIMSFDKFKPEIYDCEAEGSCQNGEKTIKSTCIFYEAVI